MTGEKIDFGIFSKIFPKANIVIDSIWRKTGVCPEWAFEYFPVLIIKRQDVNDYVYVMFQIELFYKIYQSIELSDSNLNPS